MNTHQLQILGEAKKAVTEIFKNRVSPLFAFHNLEHTRQVVCAAGEIAGHYPLNDNDQFVLFISAWFHDTGFSAGHSEEHEKESIKLAEDFLYRCSEDKKLINRVSSGIQATHIPQEPGNLVEKILCDADLYHLGTNTFNIWNDNLRQELQNYYKTDFSEEEWCRLNIGFLKSHKYFTGYCLQNLEPIKQEWIKQFQHKQRAMVK
ncbi:HD domain-containing protein [Terrimonas pollutisoli]|uniref:HD domain-containing protein n=1 Tax=Terrimonas pollutisoli TaxID=3034147 RepID=UPI0023EC8CAD|nr:HD domain-containing protein [Terrimonas sp. H1YJ31]